jgi:UDP-N-acetylmuramoylalanine--D-glutamate ligase
VVAVTSLHPDHLPWHDGDVDTYYRDKLSICTRPGADLTVANGDSDLIRAHRHLLGPRVGWVRAASAVDGTWIRHLGLLGLHNRRNALIVHACLRALGIPEADDDAKLAAAAAEFAGLDSRLKIIGTVDGVSFVDDSLSTNVLPTLAAIETFGDRRTALIVGGHSRGIDYRPLAVGLRTRVLETFVLTIPDNGPDIRRQLTEAGVGPHVTIVDAPDLAAAVVGGYHWARPDGVVLLSPAAPSFGRFRDYRERGAAFALAMHACHIT